MVPFIVFFFALSQSPSSRPHGRLLHGPLLPADQPSSVAIAVTERRKVVEWNARRRGDIEEDSRAKSQSLLGFLGLAQCLLRSPAAQAHHSHLSQHFLRHVSYPRLATMLKVQIRPGFVR
jgi:hypothetical protein